MSSKFCSLILGLTTLLFTVKAHGFEIPKGLSASDRQEIVRTIGLNSAEKLLTNPYPLGGYSGFEVGYSVEFINIRDIRRLGCTPGSSGCENTSYQDDSEWRYSRLTIGKGLYNNVDLFFSLMAPTGGIHASDYGGMVRWSFFQAEFLPINLSVAIQANQLNFEDTFVDRNVGAELLAGINVDNFALYFGGGVLESSGTFIGGSGCQDCTVSSSDSAVNTLTHTVSEDVKETHTVVGFSLHFDNLFAAAQVDRYRDAVYSMKLGLRF